MTEKLTLPRTVEYTVGSSGSSELTELERHRLLVEWNATTTDCRPDLYIHNLSERQAAERPYDVAAEFEGKLLTYLQLNQRSNRLAHYLRSLGVGPEVLIGLCVERSLDMIVALVAILKAGGAYVPLDPTYPSERLQFMRNDAGVRLILTQTHLTFCFEDSNTPIVRLEDATLWADQSPCNPNVGLEPNNLAYVIYTSGSAGLPKGALVPHRGLCNLAAALAAQFDLTSKSRVLQFASLCFDASVCEVIMTFQCGGTLVLARQDVVMSPSSLACLLGEHDITAALLPPSLLGVMPLAALPALRTLASGGENCTREAVERWMPGRLFLNAYGPTECTAVASCYSVTSDGGVAGTIPIGRPLANVRLYVLNARMAPTPVGAEGELYIGGVGVGRGYLHRPGQTAATFVPDPFSGVPGERLYRTGDRARYRSDGNVEFIGRLDHQVKLRGYRIELTEIENVLESHPQVGMAVVVVREETPGDKRLGAYVTAPQGPNPSVNGSSVTPEIAVAEQRCAVGGPSAYELRAWLRERLPYFMVPFTYEVLDSFPMTHNGKVDRDLLRVRSSLISRSYLAPTTPLEVHVVRVLEDVLGQERLSLTDDFFHVGGDSLLSTQAVCRLRHSLRLELPLLLLFESPIVGQLVRQVLQYMVGQIEPEVIVAILAEIDGHIPAMRDCTTDLIKADRFMNILNASIESLSPEQRALLEKRLLERRKGSQAPGGISPRKSDDPSPLSYSQQRLWILEQMHPGGSTYNAALAIRMQGRLDVLALHRALNAIVERHEVLRTTYAFADNDPYQVIQPPHEVELVQIDLSWAAVDSRQSEVQNSIRREASRLFDLEHDLMLRTVLIRLTDDEHIFVLIAHHIAADGWSRGILYREIAALYDAYLYDKPSPLPDLPVQYADFALWQRRWLHRDRMEEYLGYWRQRLDGAPEAIDLPIDKPRPRRQTFEGAFHWLRLPKELLNGARDIGKQERATLFMVCLAVFTALLSRFTLQDDILVGSPIANRNQPEIEGLIGFFVNTLVLRVDLTGNPTLRQLVGRSRDTALGAYQHQDVPFEEIVRAIRPDRASNRNPLFQVNFRVQSEEAPTLEMPHLTISGVDVDLGVSRFDMAVELRACHDGFEGYWEYNTALFEPDTIQRMAEDLEAAMAEMMTNPDTPFMDLPVLRQVEERTRILHEARRHLSNVSLRNARRKGVEVA